MPFSPSKHGLTANGDDNPRQPSLCPTSTSITDTLIHTYTAAEGGLFVNSYLLEAPASFVVVDTNLLAADTAAPKARLAALHKPLLASFTTHAHPDHCNGTLELVRDREVPVPATAGVAQGGRPRPTTQHRAW
jgi:glyoxylase-like metal-dependent hydrolase (beta-lactamase superfamily II)